MTKYEIRILEVYAIFQEDGIYPYNGGYWVAKNNRFVAFSDEKGNCYQRMGVFSVYAGKKEGDEIIKYLSKFL